MLDTALNVIATAPIFALVESMSWYGREIVFPIHTFYSISIAKIIISKQFPISVYSSSVGVSVGEISPSATFPNRVN
jgi:hypothetical protein